MKTIAPIVLAMLLAGCAQPGAVQVSPDLTAQVKAAVLSPEITSAISSHVQGTISGQVEYEVKKEMAVATSQPSAQTDTGAAGRDKNWYQVPIQAIGDGGIIGAVLALYIVAKMVRDVYRISRGVGRAVRKTRSRDSP